MKSLTVRSLSGTRLMLGTGVLLSAALPSTVHAGSFQPSNVPDDFVNASIAAPQVNISRDVLANNAQIQEYSAGQEITTSKAKWVWVTDPEEDEDNLSQPPDNVTFKATHNFDHTCPLSVAQTGDSANSLALVEFWAPWSIKYSRAKAPNTAEIGTNVPASGTSELNSAYQVGWGGGVSFTATLGIRVKALVNVTQLGSTATASCGGATLTTTSINGFTIVPIVP